MTEIERVILQIQEDLNSISNNLEAGVSSWEDYKFQTGRAWQLRKTLKEVKEIRSRNDDEDDDRYG